MVGARTARLTSQCRVTLFEAILMYRISRNGHDPIVDVDRVEALEHTIRSRKPGRVVACKRGATTYRSPNRVLQLTRMDQ